MSWTLRMALVVTLLCPLSSLAAPDPFGTLSVDEVAQKLGHKDVFLYDNNTREVFARGHVPGARWVDYKHVTAADLPADKGATLIFYCANEH